LIAQVDEVEEDTLPGDPDCILRDPKVLDSDGNLETWPPFSDHKEVAVRSSDITTLVDPNKDLLARYISAIE
tara:strand:+ start:304 stop:519 length:216 start_codon:yes stop_codon:yes gene_type:complete